MPHIAGHPPPIGLIGSEQALQGGFEGALNALSRGSGAALNQLGGARQQGLNFLTGATGQGVAALDPFAQPGGQAAALQAALLGASGAPAQQQAFQNFQFGPGQQFLQQQGEQSVLRGSTATGGTGGGNVLKALTRFGQGSANQFLGDRLSQLSRLSGQGLQAAGQQGQLFGQQGAVGTNLISQLGLAGAGVSERLGQGRGDVILGTGQDLARGRSRAGELIAGQIGDTVTNLQDLQDIGGQNISEVIGTGGSNLADILQITGQGQGATLQNLAAILANISTGQGSQLTSLPGIPGTQQTQGAIGEIGQLIAAGASLSDKRLKTNIKKLFIHNGFNFYSWDWIGKINQPSIGVIAQEVLKIKPSAVLMDGDGYYRVDYSQVM